MTRKEIIDVLRECRLLSICNGKPPEAETGNMQRIKDLIDRLEAKEEIEADDA